MATELGPLPTFTVLITLLSDVLITLTLPELKLATYAHSPLGVTATATGFCPRSACYNGIGRRIDDAHVVGAGVRHIDKGRYSCIPIGEEGMGAKAAAQSDCQ